MQKANSTAFYIAKPQLQHPSLFPAAAAAQCPRTHPCKSLVLSLCSPPLQLPPARFYSHEVTPCIYISTLADLQHLAKELQTEEEVGVYVESHSQHSYAGFVCLLMISSPWKDYVVDTLLLRPYIMSLLGPVFASPRPLKVFHDAGEQLRCLQRDFGMFAVNIVDTKEAALAMGSGPTTYYCLLSALCGLQYNNPYQQADWRVRPLQSYMLLYASSNTHSLLFLWDTLRVRLNQMQGGHVAGKARPGPGLELYGKIVHASNTLCLTQMYVPPTVESQLKAFITTNARLVQSYSKERQVALSKLFRLRDKIARQEDENPARVIPDEMLLTISTCTFKTAEELVGTCERASGGFVPEAVRKYGRQIVEALLLPEPQTEKPQSSSIFAALNWVKAADEAQADKAAESEYRRIVQMEDMELIKVVPDLAQECPKAAPAMALLAEIFNKEKAQGGVLAAEDRRRLVEKIDGLRPEDETTDEGEASVKAVPETFEEIYNISNRNKRRNKMLKKDKKKATGEELANIGTGADSVLKIVQSCVGREDMLGSKNLLGTAQFLRSIGWMEKGQSEGALTMCRGKKSFTPNAKPCYGLQYARRNCYAF